MFWKPTEASRRHPSVETQSFETDRGGRRGNRRDCTVLSYRSTEKEKPAPNWAGSRSGDLVVPAGDGYESAGWFGQGAQAPGADADLTGRLTIHYRLLMQVDLPPALAPVVCVADAMTEYGTPTTYVADSCHAHNPQFNVDYRKFNIPYKLSQVGVGPVSRDQPCAESP